MPSPAPIAFDWLLAEHPAIARRWLTSVAQRIAGAQKWLLHPLGASLPQQTARLLRTEADAHRQVNLSQRVLAAMLGVQRTSLNRVLRDMEADGLIALGYRSVHILPRDRLTTVAGHR